MLSSHAAGHCVFSSGYEVTSVNQKPLVSQGRILVMVWVQTVPANAHVLTVWSPTPGMLGKWHPQSAGTLQVKVKDELGHSPVAGQNEELEWGSAKFSRVQSSPEKSQQQQLTQDACFRKAGARGSETWSKPSKQAWRAADGHSRATILASTSSHSELGTVLQTCALRALKPCVPTALHKANQEDYKANKEEVGNRFGEIDWCQNGLLVHTQGLLQWLGAVSNNSQHYRDFLNPMISLFRGTPPVPVFLIPY